MFQYTCFSIHVRANLKLHHALRAGGVIKFIRRHTSGNFNEIKLGVIKLIITVKFVQLKETHVWEF